MCTYILTVHQPQIFQRLRPLSDLFTWTTNHFTPVPAHLRLRRPIIYTNTQPFYTDARHISLLLQPYTQTQITEQYCHQPTILHPHPVLLSTNPSPLVSHFVHHYSFSFTPLPPPPPPPHTHTKRKEEKKRKRRRSRRRKKERKSNLPNNVSSFHRSSISSQKNPHKKQKTKIKSDRRSFFPCKNKQIKADNKIDTGPTSLIWWNPFNWLS